MIPLVEDYLSELIQSRVDYLKADPTRIDNILATSGTRLSRLKTFVQTTPIKVIKGYPRTPGDLPCVCILLSGEDETQGGLGDYIEGEDEDIREIVQEVPVVIGHRVGGLPYAEIPTLPLVEVSRVVVKSTGHALPEEAYYVANSDLGLLALMDPDLEDGDILEVTSTYKHHSTASIEVIYECNYRLEVWSGNGDLVVDLYHLVKWSLLSGRDTLVGRGLFRQKLGGSDFEPATSYFPEFVYRRALTFWCQLMSSAPIEDIPYIGGLELEQSISFNEEE